jgi:hypothetical protein
MSSRARGSVASRVAGDLAPVQRRISAQIKEERDRTFENPCKFEDERRPKSKLADEK